MKLSAVVAPDPSLVNSGNSGTVTAAVVLAVFGWVILLATVVVIVVFVKYRQHQRTKKLRL